MTGSARYALNWVNSALNAAIELSVKWRIFQALYRGISKKSSKTWVFLITPNGHFRQQFGYGQLLGSE
jgi:hypothetical protein